jgi:maltose alpha-D-glucosyltransferase/alpha-amylase
MNQGPEWLKKAVFYQIYPQSFADSNGDGIGDIPGITARLDYLASLGVNALWLNPCFVSPFQDAGYDVADYYQVAPRYGTNADLVQLFQEAHRRGLRVVLDLVAGHTSIEHPWFVDSCCVEPNAYSDRFIWTHSVWDHGDGSIGFVNGYAERDGNYAINFFYCQPALNYGFAQPNPACPWQQPVDAPGPQATREELRRIMAFWLDQGADGFRVDMAASLVKNDPDKAETIKLWQGMRAWLEASYPQAVLIAEWSNPAQALRAGFHVDFMIHFGEPGYPSLFLNGKGGPWQGHSYFDRAGQGTVTEFLGQYLKHRLACQQGFIAVPSGNHDFQRPNLDRTTTELEVAFAFWLTWPGVPFIYYGDEIGMRYLPGLPSKEGGYQRTGTRTPMQWDDGPNAGFSSAAADDLYLPIDPYEDRPTVAAQEQDPGSLLNHVRRLVALRQEHPALQAEGEMIPLYALPERYPFVYLRRQGSERIVVAVNPADRPEQTTIALEGVQSVEPLMVRGATLALKDGGWCLAMSGVSYGIWRLN